ncbi:MAG TPA: DUF447 domain-containing protein [Burkholderiaceae bacterium]|jgi:hypothetical protein|nr:DUF447 domain-containing protein [Burkholderiaceae bacterium]
MSEPIFETVVTTRSPAGRIHVAPMGVRYVGAAVVFKPFRPSATLDNVLATRTAVLNLVEDVRIFAGCVTGRGDWPVVPVASAHAEPAVRLQAAAGHVVLALDSSDDDLERPTLRLRRVAEETHAPWRGFNRAQAAVIEGAVLVSRLRMLSRDKVEAEMRYLQIAIDRTASPIEIEAWEWLRAAVARHAEAA